jgi:hypothetical protein
MIRRIIIASCTRTFCTSIKYQHHHHSQITNGKKKSHEANDEA